MKDLEFLYRASDDDLRLLCDIILKNQDGNISEHGDFFRIKEFYHPHNIKEILPKIVDEFRLLGGNRIANFFRGEGPEYSEILRDVADRSKVIYYINSSDEQVEQCLLQKFFSDFINRASDDELKQMMEELGYPTANFTRRASIATMKTAWRTNGFQSCILLVSVVNAVMKFLVGTGLSLAANAAVARMGSIIMGPIGLVLTALWTLIDIAGPTYRVTVPAVIQIAYIRQMVNNNYHMIN